VSLITDALGLRRSKSSAVAAQETLPPFRRPQPVRWALILTAVFCVLALLAFWQGSAALGWLEDLAGISQPGRKPVPAPVGAAAEKPSTGATPKPAEKPLLPSPPPATGKPAAAPEKKVESETTPSGAMKIREEDKTEPALQPVDIPFTPTMREEDPIQAAERKKNELAAAVRAFQIQGVRLQGKDSRALINGNPVSPGESVGDGGLKLKSVEPSRLIFTDAQGNDYPRSY